MARKTAKGEEAAAIAAAVAQFEAEHSVPAASASATVKPWQHAALLEGVGAKETVRDAQGGTTWQS